MELKKEKYAIEGLQFWRIVKPKKVQMMGDLIIWEATENRGNKLGIDYEVILPVLNIEHLLAFNNHIFGIWLEVLTQVDTGIIRFYITTLWLQSYVITSI